MTKWVPVDIEQSNDEMETTVIPKAHVEHVERWPRNMTGTLTTTQATTSTLTNVKYLCKLKYTPQRHHAAVTDGIDHYVDMQHMELYTRIPLEGEVDFNEEIPGDVMLPYSTNVANIPDTTSIMIDGIVYNVFNTRDIPNVLQTVKHLTKTPTFDVDSIGQYAECVCGVTRSTVCCKEAFSHTCNWCHHESCNSMHQETNDYLKVISDLSIHATEDSGVHSNVSITLTAFAISHHISKHTGNRRGCTYHRRCPTYH